MVLIPDPTTAMAGGSQLPVGSGISVMPTAGSLTDQVAHWSLLLCAAALGIILGETYQKPQATSLQNPANQ